MSIGLVTFFRLVQAEARYNYRFATFMSYLDGMRWRSFCFLCPSVNAGPKSPSVRSFSAGRTLASEFLSALTRIMNRMVIPPFDVKLSVGLPDGIDRTNLGS